MELIQNKHCSRSIISNRLWINPAGTDIDYTVLVEPCNHHTHSTESGQSNLGRVKSTLSESHRSIINSHSKLLLHQDFSCSDPVNLLTSQKAKSWAIRQVLQKHMQYPGREWINHSYSLKWGGLLVFSWFFTEALISSSIFPKRDRDAETGTQSGITKLWLEVYNLPKTKLTFEASCSTYWPGWNANKGIRLATELAAGSIQTIVIGLIRLSR